MLIYIYTHYHHLNIYIHCIYKRNNCDDWPSFQPLFFGGCQSSSRPSTGQHGVLRRGSEGIDWVINMGPLKVPFDDRE